VPVLSFGAVASLLLGNLAAIPQRNIKRMLGYSSIGHTGFILVAIVAATSAFSGHNVLAGKDATTGQITVNVYLVSYLLATFTAFIVLAILERRLLAWRFITWPVSPNARRCSPQRWPWRLFPWPVCHP